VASIIEGYNYDIFISYRQKDNKHDGWVTEFVENLKGELESTFKEEISVYFDINPHDGLLETHDVDESLKDKLKCLIFIPIISRTYCDPKAFAWEHEFKAFIRHSATDQFGLKVKLPGGNVANRVLPVQIHDLDAEDRKMIEGELGGHLRGIEFVYKEPGVNRPLMANEDHPDNNLNKAVYRNQINKVANSIKEIITAAKQYRLQERNVQEATEPVRLNEPEKTKKTPIIIASAIALAVIIICILFIPKLSKHGEEIEKSIAVLPFINDSPSDSNQYFINGVMEEILNNLQKIKDFRVLSRTSTTQFQGSNKPTIPEIAKKLGVNYIVEGSGQKYGNKFVLRVQLIAGKKERHIWAQSYDREIHQTTDIISIHREIAQLIASELKANITPEEKQFLNNIPTSDLTAYELFLKANELREEYRKTQDLSSYQTAVDLYTAASKIDTTFAQAYVGLAWAYYDRYYWPEYFKKGFLDSCLVLANIALSIDDKLADAYYLKGVYYRQNGNYNEALISFDKTIEINPNYYSAYFSKGTLYLAFLNDGLKGLENLHKALTLVDLVERPSLLRSLGSIYANLGFFEKATYYYNEALNIDNNQIGYLWNLVGIEFMRENYEEALKLCKKILEIDSTAYINQHFYLYAPGHINEAYIHANKLIERFKRSGTPIYYFSHRIGYTFYQVGNFKEADDYFKQQIRYSEESIKLNRPYAQRMAAHYDLSATYAFLGDKTKAYQHLDEYSKLDNIALTEISFVENDPLYESIRNEERFQKIVQNMKAKNQAEHERVKKWLEENKML
jgi:TolB-like protein